MKTKLLISTVVVVLIGFIAFNNIALSDSNGMNRHAGAPDEHTCSEAGCHGSGNGNGTTGGLPDNGGPGSISISCSNMTGWIYTPGTTYHMTITLTQSGCKHFGFSAVALNSGMANTGTMVVTDNTHTQISQPFGVTRAYMTHVDLTKGQFLTTDPAVIAFDWKAPSTNEGPITIYYDGVAANDDKLEDAGDNVYKGNIVMTPNTTVSSPLIETSISNQTMRAIASVPSVPYAFYVSGQALTNNISVSVASPYELSTSSSSGFSTTAITLNQSSGSVASTQLFIRYNPSLSGTANQTLTISSTGATSKTAAFTGQTAAPVINSPSKTTIPQFTTLVGTPSAIDSFTVTFSGLMDSIIFTAPPQFQVTSTSTRDWAKTASWVPFNPIWGISNMKVYVRYSPLVAGPHSGNITISTTGGTSKTVAVSGITTGITGINEISFTEKNVEVYPNPVSEKSSLTFNLPVKQQVEISLFTLTGQKVKDIAAGTYDKGSNSISLNTSDLKSGLYLLSVQTQESNVVKRIIVQ